MDKRNLKKQLIIQSAIEVFSKNNFQNSTISQIAQKADVAEGTIYQYFKNKEDLFFSIPIEKTKEFSRDLELHLQGIDGALSKMRKFIWYYLFFFKTNPDYARTLMLELRVSKNFAKTQSYESLKPFTDRLLDIITEGQDEGVVRKDINLYLLRQLILGMLEHIVTRWLLKEEKYDLLGQCQEVNDLVLNGISFPKREKIPG
jgi:TetR/AcrR family fatty acid metabolism transcriptional regulator